MNILQVQVKPYMSETESTLASSCKLAGEAEEELEHIDVKKVNSKTGAAFQLRGPLQAKEIYLKKKEVPFRLRNHRPGLDEHRASTSMILRSPERSINEFGRRLRAHIKLMPEVFTKDANARILGRGHRISRGVDFTTLVHDRLILPSGS